jgi:4-aminobutyrate aminotransferase/(S)-3-amino-2-methylpropionate transaminase
VCQRALAAGLILLSCGTKGEAIRILVPLTVSNAILDEGLDRLASALSLEPRPAASGSTDKAAALV